MNAVESMFFAIVQLLQAERTVPRLVLPPMTACRSTLELYVHLPGLPNLAKVHFQQIEYSLRFSCSASCLYLQDEEAVLFIVLSTALSPSSREVRSVIA